MRFIRITDSTRQLEASVSPEYGGMLVRLDLGGRPILHLDERLLGMAPMLAGGMPVLFPFPSRTADDAYRLHDTEYHMPFHGLVKNSTFAVKAVRNDSVTLWIESGAAQMAENYPFAFHLAITYRISGNILSVEAEVRNRSHERLPHCLGWHPFFLASDKKRLLFEHHMKSRYDYIAMQDGPAPERMNLSDAWDDVLFEPERNEFTLDNPVEGYAVRCRFDRNHQALVVCTATKRSVCIEPWCGLPNSANSGRYLQWLEPGASGCYGLSIEAAPL